MKKFFSFLAKITLLSFFFLTVAPSALPTFSAFAQNSSGSTVSASANSNVFVDTMCNVLRIVTGNAGKAFAAFAILSLGIGFFTGKVSWGLMVGIAAGIALIWGAPTVVSALTGQSAYSCNS